MDKAPLIKVADLVKRYRDFYAVYNFNFSLNPSELVLLYGENGAGKSTVLNCLAGLSRADSGEINLRSDLNKRDIVFVSASASFLYESLTIEENLSLYQVVASKNYQANLLKSLIEKLSLAENLKKKINECSLGTIRKASIARALLLQPKILLLDEPLSNLDQATKEVCCSLFLELKNNGVGIVVASHELQAIQGIVDRGLILHRGRISKTVEKGFEEKDLKLEEVDE
jgi:ABC-type multidrug transport system ATPase subunit